MFPLYPYNQWLLSWNCKRLLKQLIFLRLLGSAAQQQQQGVGSNQQTFWLQMNCEAQMKMPLFP